MSIRSAYQEFDIGSRLQAFRRWRKFNVIAWYALCILLSIPFLVPFLWMFGSALRPIAEIFQYISPLSWKTLVPQTWTLSNFTELLVGTMWPRFIFNTFLVAGVTTILTVTVSSLAGYAFARMRFPGNSLLFGVSLTTIMIPFQITVLPLYFLVRAFGLLDTYLALILPFIANPLYIFLLRQFFLDIPKELEEAAVIDGASPFGIYRQIIMPLTWPAHISVALMAFQSSWDAFLWPLIATTSADVRVLQVAVASLIGLDATQWNLVFAGVSVAAVPPMILFLVLQRYYIRGIAGTGMK